MVAQLTALGPGSIHYRVGSDHLDAAPSPLSGPLAGDPGPAEALACLETRHNVNSVTRGDRPDFPAAAGAGKRAAVPTITVTGCRVTEALGMRACDVDLEANEVRSATLKHRITAYVRALMNLPHPLLHFDV